MNRICDILFLVKASNTVHATSKEMKTDELTIKETKTKTSYIYWIEILHLALSQSYEVLILLFYSLI